MPSQTWPRVLVRSTLYWMRYCAESGRGEHAVHQLDVGVFRWVREEIINLLQGRRQPAQVERQPADQRRSVSPRRRLEAGPLQAGQDKCIDLVLDPCLVLYDWHW